MTYWRQYVATATLALTSILMGCAEVEMLSPEQIAAQQAAERQAAEEAARKKAEEETRIKAEQAKREAEQQAFLAKIGSLMAAARDAEAKGKAREAFKQYIAVLESVEGRPIEPGSDTPILEQIIRLAHQLNPKPALPDGAEREIVFGATALKEAKAPADPKGNDVLFLIENQNIYKRAINAFEKAKRLAPWWGASYYNLGLIQEKTGDYEAAVRNYKLYLAATPEAPDTKEVKAKLYEMEYKLQKSLAERTSGVWKGQYYLKSIRVDANGNILKVTRILPNGRERIVFQSQVDGTKILPASYPVGAIHENCDDGIDAGSTHYTVSCRALPQRLPIQGEIYFGGKLIKLDFEVSDLSADASLFSDHFDYYEKGRRQWTEFMIREE